MKFYIVAVAFCLLGALNVEGKSTGRNQEISAAEYVVIGGNSYYISPPTILEDAYRATTYCDADGMKLVSFATEEKWMAVQDYLVHNSTHGTETFWSSLSKFGDSWRWGNGDFANFFAWGPNQPDEKKDAICVRFVASEGWFDQECKDTAAAFICEVIGSATTTSTTPSPTPTPSPEPTTTDFSTTPA